MVWLRLDIACHAPGSGGMLGLGWHRGMLGRPWALVRRPMDRTEKLDRDGRLIRNIPMPVSRPSLREGSRSAVMRRRASKAVTLIGVIACVGAAGFSFGIFGRGPAIPVSVAGPVAGQRNVCRVGQKTGPADLAADIRTGEGLRIRVRTPADYDPTRAYPLLVVYPPAGMNRAGSERYYALTPEATRRGFIVAYSDHIRMSRAAIRIQAKVAATIMEQWCIDAAAVSYLGHSDGGSIAQAALIAPEPGMVLPYAIVASAAGIRGEDLEGLSRSAPFRLMIVHSRDDEHFPGFGIETANQWAAHEGCQPGLPAPGPVGCATFRKCRSGSRIDYCETSGSHSHWPPIAEASFAFITQ